MNFSNVREGMSIEYIGDSFAFGGVYKVVRAESTYLVPDKCPENEKGALMIIELMNDDTPMYFRLNQLNPNEWRMAETKGCSKP